MHFVAIIKAGQPPVCLDDVASYQKQTTELKRLKGQGTPHNAKKLKFLYIRPTALPLPFFFFFFIRFLSSSPVVDIVPVKGRKKRKKEKEREKEIILSINANTE